jgi:hypothetical protein
MSCFNPQGLRPSQAADTHATHHSHADHVTDPPMAHGGVGWLPGLPEFDTPSKGNASHSKCNPPSPAFSMPIRAFRAAEKPLDCAAIAGACVAGVATGNGHLGCCALGAGIRGSGMPENWAKRDHKLGQTRPCPGVVRKGLTDVNFPVDDPGFRNECGFHFPGRLMSY